MDPAILVPKLTRLSIHLFFVYGHELCNILLLQCDAKVKDSLLDDLPQYFAHVLPPLFA